MVSHCLQCIAGGNRGGSKKIDISVNDRVSVFLELTEAHRQLDQQVYIEKLIVALADEFCKYWMIDLTFILNSPHGALAYIRNGHTCTYRGVPGSPCLILALIF